MGTTAQSPMPTGSVPADIAERAAALVNPASGLANDYLNIFNEIVMMIDLLPGMPDLVEEIGAWTPVTYRAYFAHSTLVGRERALQAYNQLDPRFRRTFERRAADLSRAARAACASVLDATLRPKHPDGDLAAICTGHASRLRARLDRMADMVNSGTVPVRHAGAVQRSRRVASRNQRRSAASSRGDSVLRTRA